MTSGEEPALERASPVRVVALAFAFLGLIGAVAFLARPRSAALDHASTLGELFASGDPSLPFALEASEGTWLPGGERVLRFAAADDAPAAGPTEFTVVEYPRRRAKAVLDEQFRRLRFEKREGGSGGGPGGGPPRGGRGGGDGGGDRPALREKGTFDWHGYEATYARLRHPEPGAEGSEGDETYYETVRLNLSTGGRCVIAYLRFPPGVVASKEIATEVAGALRPRE